MTILITGATGDLGARIINQLSKLLPNELLAVSVRNPEKASDLAAAGIEVRQGDFDDPAHLEQTFAAVDRLLIISTDGSTEERIRQHGQAIEAAKKANVGFIAYTSVVNAQESTLNLAEVHAYTEKKIAATGIPYVFFRNNWYLENEETAIKTALQTGVWQTVIGEGKIGWAAKQDYAEAIATVLSQEKIDQQIYEFSGNPLSQSDLINQVNEVQQANIVIEQLAEKEYIAQLQSFGIDEATVAFIANIQKGLRGNQLNVVSDDLTQVLKRPPLTISEFLGSIDLT